jgi:hypothetical protein
MTLKGVAWLDNIPTGTMVVLQARNNNPGAVNQYKDFKQFDRALPISKTIYQATLDLTDSDGPYEDYMKIGIK